MKKDFKSLSPKDKQNIKLISTISKQELTLNPNIINPNIKIISPNFKTNSKVLVINPKKVLNQK